MAMAMKDGTVRVQLNALVLQAVHRELRLAAIRAGRPLADLVNEALEQYLATRPKPRRPTGDAA